MDRCSKKGDGAVAKGTIGGRCSKAVRIACLEEEEERVDCIAVYMYMEEWIVKNMNVNTRKEVWPQRPQPARSHASANEELLV
jgi:hypothetical protein